MNMTDWAGQTVSIGSLLIIDGGQVYRVVDDDLAGVNIARCTEIHRRRGVLAEAAGALVRVYHSFKVDESTILGTKDLRGLWQDLFDTHGIAAKLREASSARRALADRTLREAGYRKY